MPDESPSPIAAAFVGTDLRVWPGRVFIEKTAIHHTGLLPILRHAAEAQIEKQLTELADELGIPVSVPKTHGTWSERKYEDGGQEFLEVVFTSRSFIWSAQKKLDSWLPKAKARWVGGPRDGQAVPALNGTIVWDGPLGVLVHDGQVVWRDVGDGTRTAWALMSPEERRAFRAEVEADAEVTASYDVETAPQFQPEPESAPKHNEDLIEVLTMDDLKWELTDLQGY